MFGISHEENAIGINSKLKDGKHILMWDFDTVALGDVTESLFFIQEEFFLPNIYVLSTGAAYHYHAYCMHRVSFLDAAHIISITEHVDENFFRIGCCRGYWTLRISDRKGRKIERVDTLKSRRKESVSKYDMVSFCMYSTKKKEGKK